MATDLTLRAIEIADNNINRDDIEKWYELAKQTIIVDKSLTNDEKSEAIRLLTGLYDDSKIAFNVGTRRVCEDCQLECLATSFCEYCFRNYLKANFSNWTSGNDEIDNLIQKCQMETKRPSGVTEWIPYNNLQNIKYLTKGGCSEIYTADWIYGAYEEWDPKGQQLIRAYELGVQYVVLKRLENVESANRRWFEEVGNLNI